MTLDSPVSALDVVVQHLSHGQATIFHDAMRDEYVITCDGISRQVSVQSIVAHHHDPEALVHLVHKAILDCKREADMRAQAALARPCTSHEDCRDWPMLGLACSKSASG